jgi:hypothetical protein
VDTVDSETKENAVDAVDAETEENAVDAETEENAVDAVDAVDAETEENAVDTVDAETGENDVEAETKENAVDAVDAETEEKVDVEVNVTVNRTKVRKMGENYERGSSCPVYSKVKGFSLWKQEVEAWKICVETPENKTRLAVDLAINHALKIKERGELRL